MMWRLRFKIRRRYQILIVAGAIATLWVFGIFPFGESSPVVCAEGGPHSPAGQVASCFTMLKRALAATTAILCPSNGKCSAPKDTDATDSSGFDKLAATLDALPTAALAPHLFPSPYTLSIPSGQSLTLTWDPRPGDDSVLIDRIALEDSRTGPVQVEFASAGRSAKRFLTAPDAGEMRVGLLSAAGGTLTFSCFGADCRVALGSRLK